METNCRACLKKLPDLSGDLNESKSKEDEIEKQLSFCTGIRLADLDLHPTKKVCPDCAKQIHEFYKFRSICIISHYYLMGLNGTSQNENVETCPGTVNQENESLEPPEMNTTTENDNQDQSLLFKVECCLDDQEGAIAKLPETNAEYDQMLENNNVLSRSLKVEVEVIAKSCPYCSKMYRTARALDNHMQTQHSSAIKCKLCIFTTYDEQNLTSHMQQFHPGAREFACLFDKCIRTYKTYENLKAHEITHLVPASFECSVCQRKYHMKSRLKQHEKEHDKNLYFSCDLCLKKFARKSRLVQHRKIHNKEYEFTCELCGKQFIERVNWRTHMKVHHEGFFLET